MKNKILFVFFTVFTLLSFSQERKEVEYGNAKFKCDTFLKINSEKGITEFSGNVDFKTDLVEFINADRIIYNNNTKEVLVYGTPVKIVFKGTSAQVVSNSNNDTIKYKIGDKIVYIH